MTTRKFRCKCCRGLCPWHAEHGPKAENKPEFRLICNCGREDEEDTLDFWGNPIHHSDCPAKNGRFEPPGCWGCCGSGCRNCGNTGFIPKERVIRGLLAVIDAKNAEIIALQKEVAEHQREYDEILNDDS